MEKRCRPATVSPEGPGGSNPDLDTSSNGRRTPSHPCKSDPQTPDSIERATATLFTRIRALIASQPEGSLGSSPSGAAGTSSYYGNDESRSSVGRQGSGAKTESTSSSSGVIAFGSVPQHSVPDSIFMNHLPMPGSYLHSSQPNIYKRFLSKRKLDSVSCPSEAFRAQNDDDLEDSSSDDTEEDARIIDGGLDPEKVRKWILDRPPSEPIPTTDPIVSVIYDSSSSARQFIRPTPDLFAQELVFRQCANLVKTPPNSIETPQQPLVNIIPPTPEAWYKEGVNTTAIGPSLIAHTGTPTPQEGLPNDELNGRDNVKGICTGADIESLGSGDYGYANVRASGDVPEEVESPEGSPDRIGENSVGNTASNGFRGKWPGGYYSPFSSSVTCSGSGVEKETADPTCPDKKPQSLRRVLKSSELGRKEPRPEVPIRSVERAPIRVANQTVIPLSASSFGRIIYELEEMLNQALDLASRAVSDSRTALNQRDVSQSRRRSARISVAAHATSTGDNGGARSFKTANELGQDEENLAAPIEAFGSTEATSLSTAVVGSRNGRFINRRAQCEQSAEREPYLEAETGTPGAARDVRRLENFEFTRRGGQPSGNVGPTHGQPHLPVETGSLEGHHRTLKRRRDTDFTDRPLHVRIEEPAHGNRYTGGWDWSLRKKRIVAAIACLIPGLIGFVVGCYFGEAATIQKSLRVSSNIVALGNVSFLVGVALSGLVFWPLPLLHGKKPYLLVSLAFVIPLQLPQALSLPPHTTLGKRAGESMVPYVICLLVFRSVSGVVMGFTGLTSFATILDMFGPDTGACCRGGIIFNNCVPTEGVDQFHLVPGGEAGARVGVWLGVWAWFFVAFPGIGFFVGGIIAEKLGPAWGFWLATIVDAVLFLAAAAIPEVRPPWQRLVGGERRSGWVRRRVERGELALVIFGKPPEWWWKEVWAGLKMTGRMCGQAGFLVLAVYTAWLVGQVTIIMRLLVRLLSYNYEFKSIDVGLAVLALPIASLPSIPFQLSTFYLRNFRHLAHHAAHSSMGQHRYHSSLFFPAVLLPLSSLGFTISATGPSTHFTIPVAFAAAAFFSGTLAFAECHLIL
ncbi:hypothetical protein L873DRAFT_1814648 [Choiromyces venosus 120613-1]|uniref:MFS general substrate transporter n=1 Tax=Choiromyces venosus 120613-1 TaxID=1336337 RepID=A0A3N4JAF3_9PEZI|nr:hypothetical protein L873DRAFT_1814648 [Choiromyces venosus 120613-1]